MMEAGGRGKMSQACYWVVQNKAWAAYAYRADVKAASLQKLESWLMYPVN